MIKVIKEVLKQPTEEELVELQKVIMQTFQTQEGYDAFFEYALKQEGPGQVTDLLDMLFEREEGDGGEEGKSASDKGEFFETALQNQRLTAEKYFTPACEESQNFSEIYKQMQCATSKQTSPDKLCLTNYSLEHQLVQE